MTKLSIVIPAVGSQDAVDSTLVSVLENRPPQCEIILAHAPGYQDPYDLADEVSFVAGESEHELPLVASGIDAAQGEIIHWIKPGVSATEGWTEPVMERFCADEEVGAVAPTLLDPDRTDRVLAVGLRYGVGGGVTLVHSGRKHKPQGRPVKINGPLLQAGFARASLFHAVGPFTDRFGSQHADSEFAARLRGFGITCCHVPEAQLIGTEVADARGFRDALDAEKLFWHHRRQFNSALSLFAHALHAGFDIARQMPMPSGWGAALGRCFGLLAGCLASSADYQPEAYDSPDVLPLSTNRGVQENNAPERHEDPTNDQPWAKSA